MSWANLDDRLHAHPKVRRLQRIPFAGAEAFGIWAWCLSWCRSYTPETGRILVENVALDWGADPEHFAQVFDFLASVQLVDAAEEGVYVIHDWDDWQLGSSEEWHKAGGRARAATARRVGGRFAPADQQAGSAGTSMATPLHASPLHASPAGESDFKKKVARPT